MMGLAVDDHHDPRSTPKLSLSKLPCKPKHPTQMLTPPLQPSVSIPFHWEEAPGRPRSSTEEEAPPPHPSKSRAARCLHLPPRLSNEEPREVTIMPSSPTVVLDGPYVGRSLSLACTFSFRKGPGSGGLRPGSSRRSFGRSRRWSSFRFGGDEEKVASRGSFDISQSLGDFFKSEKNVKMNRLRRVRSFFHFSTIDSNL